jgi:hypothetical protein
MRHTHTTTPSQLRGMARSMAHHQRTRSRVKRALGLAGQLLFAIALGVACTLLLLGFLTPCEAGSLCMAAVITPTRTGWRQWLHRQRQALRAAYLRARINAAEHDLEHLQAAAEHIPYQMELHRRCIAAWRVQAIDCETLTRNR